MRRKLLGTFLPLALIPLLATGVISYYLAKRTLTQKIYAHLDSIASLQKNRIEVSRMRNAERFALIVDRVLVRIFVDGGSAQNVQRDVARLTRILANVRSLVSDLKTMSIVNADGKIIASTSSHLIGKNLGKVPLVTMGRSKNVFDVVDVEGKGKFGAYFAGPLRQGQNFLGVILVEGDIDQLFPWVSDYSSLGKTGETVLVKKISNNQVLYLNSLRFDPGASLQRVVSVQESPPIQQALSPVEQLITNTLDYRGHRVIAATRSLKSLNWGLVVKIDQEEAYASISRMRFWFLLFFMASLIMVGLVVHLLARSIVKPIEHLTQTAKEIEAGNPSALDATQSFKDEIGILARALVGMARNLLNAKEDLEQKVVQRTEALTKSEERARAIIETARDAFVEFDENGLILSWNRQAEATFGWSRQEAIGKGMQGLIISPNHRQGHDEWLERHLNSGRGTNKRIETLALHKDGHEFPVEITVWPGRLPGMQTYNAFIHNITERKRAETVLLEKQKELARANAEREQLALFASVAAHDLQEPLQKIVAFGDLLKSESSQVLGEDAKGYLERMRSAAKRMSELVSDLLKLSKVTAKQEAMGPVDLKKVLEEVLLDLDLRIHQSGAKIIFGEFPIFNGSAVQFREVFLNLISNAIKFKKKDEPLEIRIKSEDLIDGKIKITVEDNGIGLDEKFAERIFQPFERLHRRSEYEGSGIGLAICQRIISNHGGKIMANGELGKGTIFTIILSEELRIKDGKYALI